MDEKKRSGHPKKITHKQDNLLVTTARHDPHISMHRRYKENNFYIKE